VSDLIDTRDRPPRSRGGDNWGDQLRIGFLIDWLDSRPEHAKSDAAALCRKARKNDLVALAVAGLSERLERQLYAGELVFTGHNDHALEYSVAYHARIAGHLEVDELPLGDEVYRRLFDVAPACLSGLVNLAEIERRTGNSERARALLDDALERAQSSTERRYGVLDRSWVTSIRCAIALCERELGDGRALLDAAATEAIGDLVALLRAYGSWDQAALAAHQAFSVATLEQRIVLHAAMRLAPVHPLPPPAAHAQPNAISLIEDVLRDARRKFQSRHDS
jgi:hypothetical protein